MKKGIFLIVMLCSQVWASGAKVKFVRGEVTALFPTAKQAVKVKRGQSIPEDTSIVTKEKSIVRLKLADGSVVSLGPKSMMVVKVMQKKKPSVFGVLKGVIRAEVKKSSKQAKNKLFIKTRTAVMGVRGTTFKTTFNPVNKNTSLVTIEGEVAMAKVKEKKATEIVEEIKEEKKEEVKKVEELTEETANKAEKVEEKVVEKAPEPKSVEDELEKLTEVLEKSEEVVSVKKGEFAGVVKALDQPTEPVKVAPKQILAIAKHDELADKKIEKSDEELIKEIYEEDADKVSKDEADASFDKSEGKLKPRNGGYVDFKTGLYVPPPKDSKFDEEKKVFVADEKKVGTVDEDTGEYIPPKGIKIDEEKGFVIDQKEVAKVASNEELNRLQASVGFLNEQVEEQVKDEEEPVNQTSGKGNFITRIFKIKNNVLNISMVPFSSSIAVTSQATGSESNFLSESASDVDANWHADWNDKFSTDFSLGARKFELKEPDGIYVNNTFKPNTLSKFQAKLNFHVNSRFRVYAALAVEDELIFSPSTVQSGDAILELEAQRVRRLRLGADYRIYDYKKLVLSAEGYIGSIGEADNEDLNQNTNSGNPLKVESGLEVFAQGRALYDFSERLKVEGLFYLRRKTIEMQTLFEQTQLDLGMGANFIWDV